MTSKARIVIRNIGEFAMKIYGKRIKLKTETMETYYGLRHGKMKSHRHFALTYL